MPDLSIRRGASLALLVAAAIAVACGGSPSGPTPPAPAPAPTPAPAPAPAPTAADYGVAMSNTMNTVFIAAMRAGSQGATGSLVTERPGVLALLLSTFSPTLYAQGNGFVANCPRGGSAQVRYGGQKSIEYNLQAVPMVYTRCGFVAGPNAYTFDFMGSVNGHWTTAAPDSPVEMQGDGMLDGIGEVPIDCTTSNVNCAGSIGGVHVGAADTPPPPNPQPCPFPNAVATPNCPVNNPRPGPSPSPAPSPSPSPTPVPVPSPTPTPIPSPAPSPAPSPSPGSSSLTGTWTLSGNGGTGTASLSQNGSSVSGSAVGVIIPSGFTLSGLSGSVSGNLVTLTIRVHGVISAGGLATTCDTTDTYSLTLSSSSKMSGPDTAKGQCVITGSPIPIPNPPPTTVTGFTTWTKQ